MEYDRDDLPHTEVGTLLTSEQKLVFRLTFPTQLFWLVLYAVIAFIGFGIVWHTAHARDNGQWGDQPSHIRQWFQNLKQPDNKYQSCCGEADAYEADNFERGADHYIAIITDGKGDIPNGTRIPVPNSKMKWDEGNPTGHGIIFIGAQGQIYCYVAPGGV